MENNRYRIEPFMSDYYIFGNGQFSELLSYALIEEKKIKKKNIFFITNKNVNKFNHIYEKEFFLINKKNLNVFIAIGNIKIREKVINKLSNKKYKFPNFISKSSKIMKKSTFGKGNIILPSTSILSPVKIKDFNILGTNSIILHHCEIDSNCSIGGGSLIGAGTKIKKNTFIGVGVTVGSLNLKIGSNSFISSGSVVLNNIPNDTNVIGNPARRIL